MLVHARVLVLYSTTSARKLSISTPVPATNREQQIRVNRQGLSVWGRGELTAGYNVQLWVIVADSCRGYGTWLKGYG